MRVPDMQSMDALLESDAVAASLANGERQALSSWLESARKRPPDPLLMKVLAGVGAWIASLFIVSFTLTSMLIDEDLGAIISGIVLMAVSVPLMRNEQSVFLRQMALAFALAGNLLIVIGGVFLGKPDPGNALLRATLIQLAVTVIAWEFLNHAAFRFVAAVAVSGLALAWCIDEKIVSLVYVLLAAEIALAALLFNGRLARRFLPLAYAAAFSFLGTLAFLEFTQGSPWLAGHVPVVSGTPIAVIVVAAVVVLATWLQRHGQITLQAAVAVVTLSVPLAFASTPGVLAAMLLLGAAYALADRILGFGAAVFLPVFLLHYYYAMNVSLAQKSAVLIASGITLLAAFALLGWLSRRNREEVAS